MAIQACITMVILPILKRENHNYSCQILQLTLSDNSSEIEVMYSLLSCGYIEHNGQSVNVRTVFKLVNSDVGQET